MVTDRIAFAVNEYEELFQVEAKDDTDDVHLDHDVDQVAGT